MVYRFIDENREYFGLRWLCRHFGISLNCYYNYLEYKKNDYYTQREAIYERIKYIWGTFLTEGAPIEILFCCLT